MGKNKAEPLECSRLPYRFPALMIIIRELDPVATDVRPPRLRKTEAAAEAPTSYLGGSVTNSARRQFRGFPFLYFRRGSWRLFYFVRLRTRAASGLLMQKKSSNWAWVPPLYFIEGLPNAIVASLSVGYYMSMGVGNAKAAMLTSGLYLPWFLKGLWGPFVDSVSTKRKWIFFCTAIFAVCFAGLALAGFFPRWIAASALMFWTLGFASATFDIAADGFYMLALDDKSQSFFVGIRNAFYRIAVLFGQGAMLVIAGYFGKFFDSPSGGWAVAFLTCAAVCSIAAAYFSKVLPRPQTDAPRADSSAGEIMRNMRSAFAEFFSKRHILSILAFVLFYRFAEAQLLKIVQPFLYHGADAGGLGLSLETIGVIYGTAAPVALLGGGIVGGIFISKTGLKRAMLPMALAMNLPNVIYVYMAIVLPQSHIEIASLICVEQFGYGFGFAGYMVYLMWASAGGNRTSTYAIFTSFMALGIMFPGFFSGSIQESVGYLKFFEWVLICTLVSFFVSYLAYRTLRDER